MKQAESFSEEPFKFSRFVGWHSSAKADFCTASFYEWGLDCQQTTLAKVLVMMKRDNSELRLGLMHSNSFKLVKKNLARDIA